MFLNEYDIICLIEGRTKEQQEKGQREMAKQALEPLYRIKEFFLKRWYSGGNVKRNAILNLSSLGHSSLNFLISSISAFNNCGTK